MIDLGCFDDGVGAAGCQAYLQTLENLTRLPLADVTAGLDKIDLHPLGAAQGWTVAQVQQALKDLGLFPGGRVDGLCGYRTQSAIRLFQELVRTQDAPDCTPDGRCGPVTQGHLKRWLDQGLRAAWQADVDTWRAGQPAAEYAQWLALLEAVKQQALSAPSPLLQKVNAWHGDSDTRPPARWDFGDRDSAQLVGIRFATAAGKFDDLFVLLLKGLVFKFQGTTEPGASDDPAGPPYLVPGQHDYHFGWHKRSYLALRPQKNGVLVLRAGADRRLDDSDLARPLEANATINVHWGGRGLMLDVNNWSEGCQTINGSLYQDPAGRIVSCADFAAATPAQAQTDPSKTRGAYNVLLDLVTAYGSDLPQPGLKYTLIQAADLALSPSLQQAIQAGRERALSLMGG